jgi:hypothetical protein
LKEKDSLLRSAEGSLAEARSQNKNEQRAGQSSNNFGKNSDRFDHESKALNARVEAEIEKNVKLSETITNLRDRCFGFATQCIARLKGILSSIGAASKEVTPSFKDIPGALKHIEKEVDVLDEVITGHGDFCALVASRVTTAAFLKAGCNHVRAINRPNFGLSPSDLDDTLV